MLISVSSFAGLVKGLTTEAALNPNNLLTNGDFELTSPVLTAPPKNAIISQTGYAGWNTLETDHMLELWQTGFTPGTPGGIAFPSHSGNWLAEINANMSSPDSALYQDLTNQVPGTLYQWSFWHSGRSGKDVSMILLGSANELNDVSKLPQYVKTNAQPESTQNPVALPTTTAFTNEVKGDNLTGMDSRYFLAAPQNTWTNHWGYWTSSSDTVRFLLYSYYSSVPSGTSGKAAVGNLVDDCAIYQVAVPTTQTVEYGDEAGFTKVKQDLPGFSILLDNTTNVIANHFTGTPDLTHVTLAEDPHGATVDLTQENSLTPNTYLVPVTVTDNTGAVVGIIYSTVIVEGGLTTEYDDITTGLPIPASVITDNLGGVTHNVLSPQNTNINQGDTIYLPVFTAGQVIQFDGARYRYVKMDTTYQDTHPTENKMQYLPSPMDASYTSSNPYPLNIDINNVDKIHDYNYVFRMLLPVAGAVTGLPDNGNIIINYSYVDPDSGVTVRGTTTTNADGSYTIPDVPEGATNLTITSPVITGYDKSADYSGKDVTRSTINDAYYFNYTPKQYTVSGNLLFQNQDGSTATANVPNLNNWTVRYYVYPSTGDTGTPIATGSVTVGSNGAYTTPAFDYQSVVKVVPTPPTGFVGWAVDVSRRTTAPLTANVTKQDFIYKPTITVSGTVIVDDANGKPINQVDPTTVASLLQGKTVDYIINTPSGGTITGSIPVNPDGTYVISDAIPGVTIDPGSTITVKAPTSLGEPYYKVNTSTRTLTNVITSVSGVDFVFDPQYVTVSGYLFNQDTAATLDLSGVTVTLTYTLNGKTYPALTTTTVKATANEPGNFGDGRELYSNGESAIDGTTGAYTPISGSTNGYYVFNTVPIGAFVTVNAPTSISDVAGNSATVNITTRNRDNIQANATHCDFIYNYSAPVLSVSGTLYKVDASGNNDGVMANTNLTYTIYDPVLGKTYTGTLSSDASGNYLLDSAAVQAKYPGVVIPVGCDVTIRPAAVSMYHLDASSRSITNLTNVTSKIDFTYYPDPLVSLSGYLYNNDDTGSVALNGQSIQYSWSYVDATGTTITGGGTITSDVATGLEPGSYGLGQEVYGSGYGPDGNVIPGFVVMAGSTNGYYQVTGIPKGANVTITAPATVVDSNGINVVVNTVTRARVGIEADTYHADFVYSDQPQPIVVAGTVYQNDGSGYQTKAGVTLQYTVVDPNTGASTSGTITTDASGFYQLDDASYAASNGNPALTILPPGCSITITAPDQADYTLNTKSRTVEKLNGTVTGLDFYYDPIGRVTVSGYLIDQDNVGKIDLSNASKVSVKYSYSYTDTTGVQQTITGTCNIAQATGDELGAYGNHSEASVPVTGSANGYYEIPNVPIGADITMTATLYVQDDMGNYATVDVASRTRTGVMVDAYHCDFIYHYDETIPQIVISGTVYIDDPSMNHVDELNGIHVKYIISDADNHTLYSGEVLTHANNGVDGYYVIDNATIMDSIGDPGVMIPMGSNIKVYIEDPYSDAQYGTYTISAASRSFVGVNADIPYVDFEYVPTNVPQTVTLQGKLSMQDGSAYNFSTEVITYTIYDGQGQVVTQGSVHPDAQGHYSITNIPVGSKVTVDPSDSVTQQNRWGQGVARPIDVRERSLVIQADVTDVNFQYTVIPDPSISGTLIFLNDEGNAITTEELANVLKSLPADQIQYSLDGGKTWSFDNITIDPVTGAYTISQLSDGVHVDIKVKDVPGYQLDASTYTVDKLTGDVTNVNFTYRSMTNDHEISGKLIVKENPDYKYVNDEAVTVTYNDHGTVHKMQVRVNQDGTYVVTVPDGCTDVVITPPVIPGYTTPEVIRISGPITGDRKDNNFIYVKPEPIQQNPTNNTSNTTNTTNNTNINHVSQSSNVRTNAGPIQGTGNGVRSQHIIQTGDILYLGTFFVSLALSIVLFVIYRNLKGEESRRRMMDEVKR